MCKVSFLAYMRGLECFSLLCPQCSSSKLPCPDLPNDRRAQELTKGPNFNSQLVQDNGSGGPITLYFEGVIDNWLQQKYMPSSSHIEARIIAFSELR